jgi:hypothetical protein
MNILSRDKQVEVIAALCDGLGIRAVIRITGVNRGTVGAVLIPKPIIRCAFEAASRQYRQAAGPPSAMGGEAQ